MNFNLTEEQTLLQKTAREFANNELYQNLVLHYLNYLCSHYDV